MPVARRTPLTSPLPATFQFRAAIAADNPTAAIQRLRDALTTVMKEAGALPFDQRYQRLAPAIIAATETTRPPSRTFR
jgi:hypothetical protein